uniref:Uncharacterized protein n=1 Tax=Rhizophora mucronata TaxID=61149 RepID=A0A2P2IYR9_RHIMU
MKSRIPILLYPIRLYSSFADHWFICPFHQ